MSTQTTTLKRPPKKQPKQEHPSLVKAKEALEAKNSNPNTPLMNVQPESEEITLSVSAVYKKSGYKVAETIMDYFQWRKIPVSAEWLNGLARALVDWSHKDTSYHWIYFCDEHGLDIDQFGYLVGKYPIIAQAKAQAREVIAARRDVDALRMKLSGSVMLGTQSYHSPSFKEHETWKNALKNPSITAANTSYNVVFPEQGTPREDREPDTTEQIQE